MQKIDLILKSMPITAIDGLPRLEKGSIYRGFEIGNEPYECLSAQYPLDSGMCIAVRSGRSSVGRGSTEIDFDLPNVGVYQLHAVYYGLPTTLILGRDDEISPRQAIDKAIEIIIAKANEIIKTMQAF